MMDYKNQALAMADALEKNFGGDADRTNYLIKDAAEMLRQASRIFAEHQRSYSVQIPRDWLLRDDEQRSIVIVFT